MVDRINNQRFYDYSKVSQQKRETTEAAEFNLNMGKDGVTYEKSQRKKPEKSQELSPEPEEQKFVEEAKKYHILLVAGSTFSCPGYVRLAYCVSYEMLERSLPAFEKLAEVYRRK